MGQTIGYAGPRPACWPHLVRRLIEITSGRHQTQGALLDWLRVEDGIEKASNKLLAVTELHSGA